MQNFLIPIISIHISAILYIFVILAELVYVCAVTKEWMKLTQLWAGVWICCPLTWTDLNWPVILWSNSLFLSLYLLPYCSPYAEGCELIHNRVFDWDASLSCENVSLSHVFGSYFHWNSNASFRHLIAPVFPLELCAVDDTCPPSALSSLFIWHELWILQLC